MTTTNSTKTHPAATYRAKKVLDCNRYSVCASEHHPRGKGAIGVGDNFRRSTITVYVSRGPEVQRECVYCLEAAAEWEQYRNDINAAKHVEAKIENVYRCEVFEKYSEMGIKSPRTGTVLWVPTAKVPGWLRKAIRLEVGFKPYGDGLDRPAGCPLLAKHLHLWLELSK